MVGMLTDLSLFPASHGYTYINIYLTHRHTQTIPHHTHTHTPTHHTTHTPTYTCSHTHTTHR